MTSAREKTVATSARTNNARTNYAKLKSTVATGNTSIGIATLRMSPPFSRIEPVDIMTD